MTNLTPMMQQYHSIKAECRDALLFFRLGDFYEMFGPDAIEASKILEITLTARNKNADPVPMCGIPYHAAENYIARLTKAGKKVAICEQISDPALPGIVKRKIVRIITPGTTFSEQVLNGKSNRYILAIYPQKDYFGIAFADLSTGEFQATELQGINNLQTELLRLSPAEIILHRDNYDDPDFRAKIITLSEAPLSPCDLYEEAFKLLTDHFNVTGLEGFGISGKPFAIQASAILTRYLKDTQKNDIAHLDRISAYHREEWMELDESTIRNLELFKTLRDSEEKGTLLSIIDETLTSSGGRMLRSWLTRPLVNREAIEARQDAVEELLLDNDFREKIIYDLRSIQDLQRLLGRLSSGSGSPRDLIALSKSLAIVPSVKSTMKNVKSRMLQSLQDQLFPLEGLTSRIDRAILDEPSLKLNEGNIIKEGFSEELDELHGLMKEGRSALKNIEKTESESTGISSLKVGYNRVFGYYIEVSKANQSKVPDHYIRKQTLTGAERYITPALKEFEEKILTAKEKANELEYEIFQEMRTLALQYITDIKHNANALAKLDVLTSFAKVAIRRNYVKPIIEKERKMHIEEGRHPVVESMTFETSFIPNPTTFKYHETEIKLITGPNMSGKSTYLRQVALIALMTQIGSFVPAKSARISLFDRIFTRVGASDNLVKGQSTFMVEMQECALILNHATEQSLIILDEVGRGTSTYDGVSLAWAILEFLHDKTRAFALFATHYHELIALADKLERVKNYSIEVRENSKGVLFLHKIIEGAIDKSYGIEVAKLAGMPRPVIERATNILLSLEKNKNIDADKIPDSQMDLFTGRFASQKNPAGIATQFSHPALEKLGNLDINDMTPIEALNALNELKKLKE